MGNLGKYRVVLVKEGGLPDDFRDWFISGSVA